jgi:hypothetical protein
MLGGHLNDVSLLAWFKTFGAYFVQKIIKRGFGI